MTRWAVVAVPAPTGCPPGIDATAFGLACASDVLELCSELADVQIAVAGADPHALGWPAIPRLPSRVTGELPGAGPAALLPLLSGLGELAASHGLVVAGDAPDLPPLLLGKLWSGLSSADVAVTPAVDGGLVALAARLPIAPWLADLDEVTLATETAALVAAAPTSGAVVVGPGWHRLRRPADLARLDPGLEGWDALRLLLSAPRR